VVLFIASLFSLPTIAHSDDINQATLSLDSSEQYQLVVTVDFIHLLKQHLEITGDDVKVIDALNQLSFIEQKKLLDNVKAMLSRQTIMYFHSPETSIQQPAKQKPLQATVSFNGLQLQHLKGILSQQANLSAYKAQLIASSDIPKGATAVAVRFSPLLGNIVLKIIRPQQEIIARAALSANYQINLTNASLMKNTAILPAQIKQAVDYIYQGFVHILPRGADHMLFVLALLLFAKRRSSLIWQVSAFTLAHTITLALSIYGIVALPNNVIEPLIALSIVYVGLENIYRARKNTVSQMRMPVIFAFGLLHGLGFASVLRDIGLPQSQYAMSLVSFNIGVELGQLAVITLAFIALYPFRHKTWYQTKLVLALNIAIASIATYWLIERLS
tara:strand:- start:2019 stop:3179 length:1161 start_codon:yes stop_codon:yes gene_type:complete